MFGHGLAVLLVKLDIVITRKLIPKYLFMLLSIPIVIAVAEDCDVFVLMVTAYAMKRPQFKWFMKYGGYKYADVQKVVRTLGYDESKLLAHYHALTGCDTTSYFFRIGKTIPFKKALDNGKLELISGLGSTVTLSEECLQSCKEFIRTVLYRGKPNENYVQTRMRLYDQQSENQRLP